MPRYSSKRNRKQDDPIEIDDHLHPVTAQDPTSNERSRQSKVSVNILEDDEKNEAVTEVDAAESEKVSTASLSNEECEELLEMTIEEIERKFKDKFHLNVETELTDAILLDYFVTVVYWCKQQKYSPQQLSGLYNIVHTIIYKVKDDHISMVDLMKEFCNMTSAIDSQCTDHDDSLQFFNMEQRISIVSYLHFSLLQHLKLYQYVFSRNQKEETITHELEVELPVSAKNQFPPYLDEGVSESVIREFVGLQTPSSDTDDMTNLLVPDVVLPLELEDIFGKLTPEDVRNIINQVSTEVLTSLEYDIENKVRTQEGNILEKINKMNKEQP